MASLDRGLILHLPPLSPAKTPQTKRCLGFLLLRYSIRKFAMDPVFVITGTLRPGRTPRS
jgi:hypothetical protein